MLDTLTMYFIPTNLLLFSGVNVQTLEVWQGANVSPFMHSLHFFYSLGGILGSVISPPFLSTKRDTLQGQDFNLTNERPTLVKGVVDTG